MLNLKRWPKFVLNWDICPFGKSKVQVVKKRVLLSLQSSLGLILTILNEKNWLYYLGFGKFGTDCNLLHNGNFNFEVND